MAEQWQTMKLLVVQVAALGWDSLVENHPDVLAPLPFSLRPVEAVFPAVTCSAQASFRTGSSAAAAGSIGNGRFDRVLRRTEFWSQSARLVRGPRIWSRARARGLRVGMLFWQQSLGEDVDLVLSPAPVHKHHGGMIQDCYGQPETLYPDLVRRLGRPFDLMRYWGPAASIRSSRWIVGATQWLLTEPRYRVDLLLTYIPHLDYALQKHGPEDARARTALAEVTAMLAALATAARNAGYEVVVWGDYAITAARQPLFPNQALREAGLFRVRHVRGMTYPDLYASRAFALVDHQVAHVFVTDPDDIGPARQCLGALQGVECIEGPNPDPACPETGELVLTAAPGAWFAYPWWQDPREAPDYARHVDIHSKIGFDPCELLWGWPPPSISLDATRVRGTHGRTDARVCLGSTVPALHEAVSTVDLARRIAALLDAGGTS